MVESYVDTATELTRQLIRCPSVSGEEAAVADTLKKAMETLGFDEVHQDKYGNIIGVIKGNRPGPCVLLDGHIDTVPVPDESAWSVPPFAAEIKEGRVYGRGASDMKGAVAAMTVAASSFLDATNRDFGGTICVAGVVHEECFEGVAAREISQRFKPDYVIIGEASELNLKIGQRGRAEIVVETLGVPAHSANPEKGVNAVHSMTRLITRMEEVKPESHPILGEGICVLTDIKSTPYPGASVVPSNCRVTYDRRLLVGEDRERVLAPFLETIDLLKQEDPDFEAQVYFASDEQPCYTGAAIEGTRFFPAWLYDEKEAFVTAVLSELQEAGLKPAVSHYAFCTNGSHYAGEADIATLGFGPSQENLAHTIDEYIEIEQLHKGVLGYQAILRALLKL
ncbi:YgeY family selenium metabolism-linked hydrolase [Desulfosediminicola ganghwensis]|uniref:YgeY family selenium metabolism-linked hydrolase n=1 Tax=Desulfosediminicola ganghwensis TaxID=2569540 RepID=UPI001C3D2DF5|nr:YgeY family selenium metabolism-linked hydrolase [Desulfosediminicola ganghwensis]